jgi:hypothetical protein
MAGFHFVRTRASALAEGALVALIAALVAGLAGLGPLAAAAGDPGPVALEGVLVVRHGDDFARGQSVNHSYFLVHDNLETELAFQDAPPDDSISGQRIRVTGAQHGKRFLVAAGGTKRAGGNSSPGAGATGTRSVAVVLLNFSNSPTEPYSTSYATGVAFTNADSVAAYYAESSWGQLTLTGQVFGWYTVPETNETCATGAWANSATMAAAAEGVDLAGYDHVVYAFPYVPSCGWSGLATMPGRSSWLNGQSAMALRTMAHELGHNFGTHHASSMTCTEAGVRVALSATCTFSEYGDPFTVMGSASRRHPTNFSRGNFGWLSNANAETVTVSGNYTIQPIETDDPTGVKLLRVPRDDIGTYLTLEYRQPFGSAFDAFSVVDPVVNGVTVRLSGDLTARRQSRLVDSTPATTSFLDAPLISGMTLTDPVSGVSVTTLAVSSAGAEVLVVLDSPTPSPGPTAAPEPTATPEPTPTPTPEPTPNPEPTPRPDAEAPTTPAGLEAALGKGKKVALTWTASSDNVAVAGYRVFRDGVEVGTTSATGYVDAIPGRAAAHTYFVVAYDSAGNASAPSEPTTITP